MRKGIPTGTPAQTQQAPVTPTTEPVAPWPALRSAMTHTAQARWATIHGSTLFNTRYGSTAGRLILFKAVLVPSYAACYALWCQERLSHLDFILL
eukprot:148266-Amphidinium_carterae.1